MKDLNFDLNALVQNALASITYGVPVGGVKATATITITDYTQLALKTVTVNGNALLAGTNWTAGVSNNATATSLASAINALANVGAAAVGPLITITADVIGTTANAYGLTTDAVAGITLSGATMAGGVNGDTVVVNGTTCTCVAASPAANQFSTIAELEVLTEAIANINSTQDGTKVYLTADAPGTGGNAYTLSLGGANAGTMSISGATFSGGVAATYTDVLELTGMPETANEIDAVIAFPSGAGSSPTLTVTPQVSLDKINWIDRTASAALTPASTTEMQDRKSVV